ncbi:Rv1355c family protein [Nocardia australiensis]|uniref:Rv1355c family protein n=1 Tax=Nocardia australiensis TaxID=2887191 RepID=UPI001D148CEC|nr:Rv1355c family protein [Nocardia australiensis]
MPVAQHRPLILDEADPHDAETLAELRNRPYLEFTDLRAVLRAEFDRIFAAKSRGDGPESDRWIYYPWRRAVVGLPGERTFRATRFDRNRNKLTPADQDRLAELTIGIVGQSAGHAVAHMLAMEGVGGRLRLADLDDIELSNLNRVPGTLFDIGVNKAVVTARRIAELDPYLPVEIFGSGVDEHTVDAFLDGLSIVVEECDSLDIKLAVREAASRHRVPLLMETSDRGLLDVERYDLEPDRPPFHGLLGGLRAADMRGLTAKEKAPFIVRMFGPTGLSPRLAASMVEVGEAVTSWPQLGSDVLLGASNVATAARRIGLGLELRSGRVRIDVENHLDDLADPEPMAELVWDDSASDIAPATEPVDRVLECAQRAPSGGNMQPWSLRVTDGAIHLALATEYTTAMDVGYRGSAVAVGAAVYNARVAAAAHGILGEHTFVANGDESRPLSAVLELGTAGDAELAVDYPAALARETNRQPGTGAAIAPAALAELHAAAELEHARLHVITTPTDLAMAATLLGESDRVRYLTPRLHEEMLAEVRWPADDPLTGLDVRSLELTADELAAFEIGRRADVMAQLRSWAGGVALGNYTRDRVRSSSALVAVSFDGRSEPGLAGYARAGAAVERIWIRAQRLGLTVQPISPVFLYAQRYSELVAISPDFADTLASIQGHFLNLLGMPKHETMALVLRLSFAEGATVRSQRRPVPGAETRS